MIWTNAITWNVLVVCSNSSFLRIFSYFEFINNYFSIISIKTIIVCTTYDPFFVQFVKSTVCSVSNHNLILLGPNQFRFKWFYCWGLYIEDRNSKSKRCDNKVQVLMLKNPLHFFFKKVEPPTSKRCDNKVQVIMLNKHLQFFLRRWRAIF